MNPGSVAIDGSGNVTGTGAALVLYTAIAAAQQALAPLPNPAKPDADWDEGPAAWSALMTPAVIQIKTAWVAEANAHAQALLSRVPTGPISNGLTFYPLTGLEDIVLIGARSNAFGVILSATTPVGGEVEVVDTTGGSYAITVSPSAGTTIIGTATVPALGALRVTRISATQWISRP